MSGEGYRVLLDCRRRGDFLRARGFTHDQIADVFAAFLDMSPLRLHRYAHGRTASEVIATFNDLDPAGTASLRECRLYDYEAWPARGKRPSARSLAVFARIYRTSARRLVGDQAYASYTARDRDLIDRADHRLLAPHEARPALAASAWGASMERAAVRTRDGVPGPAPVDCPALLRALTSEEADVKRRDVLFELALVLGGAPALTLLRRLTHTEKDRLATALRATGRVDSHTVTVIEKLTAHCRHLDDDFGPRSVLPVAESQRRVVADLLGRESLLPSLRERLTHAYAQLSQLSAYLHYDLMNFAGASTRYEDALSSAHQLGDPTLIAYVHTCLSWMAADRGLFGEAEDHIFAAQGWARRSSSDALRSVHAMEAARVLARTGKVRDSERALAQSIALVAQPKTESDPGYLYWWSADRVHRQTAACSLYSGRLDQALESAQKTLGSANAPTLVRAEALLHCAEALTRRREVPAAAEGVRHAAHLTKVNSSARLTASIRQARGRLQPWAGSKHVRHLDEELRSLGLTSATGG